MGTEQLANQPVKLEIEGVDSGGNPAILTFALCRSLSPAVAVALDRDLLDLGKRSLTPHHRMRPQLESLAAEAKVLRIAGDADAAAQLLSDRSEMLRCLTDNIISGRADDLAANEYWIAGRRSIDGLVREISERVKQAGGQVTMAELSAVITTGNAGLVFASLQTALGEIGAVPT